MEDGYCLDIDGEDQNERVIQLDMNMGEGHLFMTCLQLCLAHPGATGCEVIWNEDNHGCYLHTSEVALGSGSDNHKCWILSKNQGTVPFTKYSAP